MDLNPFQMHLMMMSLAFENTFSKIKGDDIIQNNYKAAFALKHIAKDLHLAKEEGLTSALGNTA
jgi:3-hydroxyisobutyrate dehydrogenase